MSNWDDISDSLKASLYDRGKSPFYGAFVISWIGWNWRLIYTIIGDGKQDFEKRIEIITNNYASWLDNLIYPLVTAAIVFVLGNVLTSIFLRFKYKFSNYRRDKIQKLDLLDEKQTQEMWKKIGEKEIEINRMLSDKITEIESLKNTNNELNGKIANIEQENIELKKINLDKSQKVETLQKEIDKLNDPLKDFDIDTVTESEMAKNAKENFLVSKILNTMVEQFQLANLGQAKVIYYAFIENNENRILKSVLKRKTNLTIKLIDQYVKELPDFVYEDWDSGEVYVKINQKKWDVVNRFINLVEIEVNDEKSLDNIKESKDSFVEDMQKELNKEFFNSQNTKIKSDFITFDEGSFNVWAKVTTEHNVYSNTRSLYIVSHCGNGGLSVSQEDNDFENVWAISRVIRANTPGDSYWKFSCSSDKNHKTEILSSRNLNPGWHMFSVTWSKKENFLTFYIDGIEQGKDNAENLSIRNEDELYIGNWPTETKGHSFNSRIGNISIYNYPLNDSDINKMYLEVKKKLPEIDS